MGALIKAETLVSAREEVQLSRVDHDGDLLDELLFEGEAILRELGVKLELGLLLFARGEADAAAGRLSLAREALAEAQSLAEVLDVGPHSLLWSGLSALRAHLEAL